jgi:hypothetical protein
VSALPWQPWPGCETVEYRSIAGESVRFLMRTGATGRLMPPVKLTTLPVPGGVGSRLLGAQHLERPVVIPVAFPGTITDRDELRRWARVLDPVPGEGTLTVVDGAHPGRFLRCSYEAGLDELAEELPNVNLGALVFRAVWPYWLEGSEQSITVSQGTTLTKWFPFLPLILGASSAFANFVVTVTGDVPSWPVFSIAGPGNDFIARNLTTGKSWHVTGTLAAGDTLLVDTRPSYKTVTVNGVNAYARMTADSSLWPLVPGQNRIEIAIGATTTASLATMTWRNAWLAA